MSRQSCLRGLHGRTIALSVLELSEVMVLGGFTWQIHGRCSPQRTGPKERTKNGHANNGGTQ